jgi:hypothetical protein
MHLYETVVRGCPVWVNLVIADTLIQYSYRTGRTKVYTFATSTTHEDGSRSGIFMPLSDS